MKTLVPVLVSICSILFSAQAQVNPPAAIGLPATAASRAALRPPPGASTPYSVVSRGPHHRVWAQVTWTTNATGRIMARTNSYTEVATGMHYLQNGGWAETREPIEVLAGGQVAAATNGPHQAYFPADLYTGAIEVLTPDGKHLRSRPLCLNYFDGTNNVLIAELTNSIGQVLPSGNQVLWTNCFTGIQADVLATYRKNGVECDLVLRSRPPAPEGYGLGAASTLQLYTEFFDTPEPTRRPVKGSGPNRLADVTLDFGALKMVRGKAFLVGDPPDPKTRKAVPQGASFQKRHPDTPVYKQWGEIEGRTFLIEEVPYQRVAPQLNELSAANGSSTRFPATQPLLAGRPSIKPRLSLVPHLAALRAGQHGTNTMQVAKADLQPRPGFVLDYVEVVGATNEYTFQSDQTYFVSGEFDAGTLTIEGGTVVKFPESNWAPVYGDQMLCQTGPYRVATLTSENDDSVGQTLPWSSGSPTAASASTYLYCGNTDTTTIKYLRAAYSDCPIYCDVGPMEVWNSQFLSCMAAVVSPDMQLHNVLFANCWDPVMVGHGGTTVRGEHITADGCEYFVVDEDGHPESIEACFTNSLFTGLSNPLPGEAGSGPGVVVNPPGVIYQSAGAGSYYLADNSPYRNAGTTNINPGALAELRKKTTYAPISMTGTIYSDTTLAPQAQRDTDAPDLGYHYDPIDYLYSCCVSNATVTLTNGVVMAFYDTLGFWLHNGSRLVSGGTATARNYLVHYSLVQEEPVKLSPYGPSSSVALNPYHTDASRAPSLAWRFTSLMLPVSAGWLLYTDAQSWEMAGLDLRDCELYAAGASWNQQDSHSSAVTLLRNNLFRDADVWVTSYGQVTASNNLFVSQPDHGVVFWSETPTPCAGTGSAFDGCWVYVDSGMDHNAYLNGADPASGLQLGDIVTNLTWVSGPLGGYYQPAGSPLINAGSTSAANAGLYHYTTQTNQVKETNSVVDIGYHYVALAANGNPIDSDGDGTPDYLADANGNGQADPGETLWAPPPSITTQPASVTVVRGTNVTLSVAASGTPPLSCQWRFNGTDIAGASNSTLGITNAQPSDAGSYAVLVSSPYGATLSSNATLTVLVPPSITTQPASQIARVDDTVSFSVAAAGTASLGYQWRWNGTNLAGATSTTFAITNALMANAGGYSVVVTNAAGSVTSAVATLTMLSLPSGMVAWWPGNGNANDIMGGYNGTLMGGATATNSGKVGQAFRFDGTNGYVQIADAPALRPANLTVEAWVSFAGLNSALSGTAPAGDQYIVFKQNSRMYYFEGYSLEKYRVANGDAFMFTVASASGQEVALLSQTLISTSVWYHVAAVRGSNFMQLYVNGQLESQTNVSFAQDYGTLPLYFGTSHQSYWDGKLNGRLDEVALYNRALSTNEIQAIYNAGPAGKSSAVSVVSPPNGSCFLAPASLVVSASVLSPSTVSKVAFFANGTKLGESSTATNGLYCFAWTNPPAGLSSLVATMTNSAGVNATSAPVAITIDATASFLRGINLNGTNVVIEGNAWQSYSQALAAGFSVTNASTATQTNIFPLSPATNADTGLMLQTFLRCGDRLPSPAQQATNPPHYFHSSNHPGTVFPDCYFDVTLSNVPPGCIVSNGIAYRGWCADHDHGLDADMLSTLYYTYGPYQTADRRYTNVNFNRLNYLVNHKQATNYMEIQNAVWALLGSTLDAGYLTANFTAMTNDAIRYGTNFVPTASQVALVLCDCATNRQPVLIETGGGQAASHAVGFTMSLTNLANTDYYAWLWAVRNDTNCPLNLDLNVQGLPVASGLGTNLALRSWSRFGPFGGAVTNGKLQIDVISPSQGDAMLMGLAIYAASNSQPPSVAVNPSSQTVCPSSSATLYATNATGSSPISYQWKFNSNFLPGATNSSLTLANAQPTNAGTYTVTVTNIAGSASANATLAVWTNVTMATAPASTNVCPGMNATFSVGAVGTGLSYQWFKGTNLLANRTSSSLTLTNVGAGDAGAYSVTVSGTCNSTNACATLTVWTNVTMVTAPASTNVCPGMKATFSVGAAGTGLSYQWFKGTNLLANRTSSSLTLTNVGAADAGAYSVTVSGTCNSTNACATLAVWTNVTITTAPASTNVCPGMDATFSVGAGGTGLSYQWFKGTNLLASRTSSSLTLTNVGAADAGAYCVTVSGTCNSTNACATLAVWTNTALSGPTSQLVFSGTNVVFTTTPGQLAYAWKKNRVVLPGRTSNQLTLTNVSWTDAGLYTVEVSRPCGNATNSARLTVWTPSGVVAWGDSECGQTDIPSGLANVVAIAGGGEHSLALRSDGTVVAWGWNDYGQTDIPSGLANVVAIAGGGEHSLALRSDGTVVAWGWNDYGQTDIPSGLADVVAIAGGYGYSLALRSDGTVVAWGWNYFGQTNVPSGLANVVAIAGGDEHSLALRSDGTVVAWGDNTHGQTNIPSGLADVVAIAAGAYHSLALRSDGTVVAWGGSGFGQTNIPSGLADVVAIAGGSYHTLALRSDGTVVAWGYNGFGQTDIPSGLTNVVGIAGGWFHNLALGCLPPAIVVQPTNQTACAGSSVSFTVTATGTAPLGYQWKFNSNSLPGATNSSLTLANAQPADSGAYAVLVTNAFGSALSSNAILTVTNGAAPVVQMLCPTNNQLFVLSPTNILLVATATNAGGSIASVEFYTNNVWLGEATAVSNQYQFLWQYVLPGTNTITAWATNNLGGVGPSAPVTNIIINAMPVVVINSPTNLPSQQSYVETTNVTLVASAFDRDGTVTAVRFFSGTNLLGSASVAGTNYVLTWSNRFYGTYPITALATDDRGAASASSIAILKVASSNLPPTVRITDPASNAVFRAGADLTLCATANSSNGIALVEFFQNGVRLGGDASPPYELDVRGLWPGTYQFTAKATSSNGLTAVSQVITNTVLDWMPLPANGYWDPAFYPFYSDKSTLSVGPSNQVMHTWYSDIYAWIELWQSCSWNDATGVPKPVIGGGSYGAPIQAMTYRSPMWFLGGYFYEDIEKPYFVAGYDGTSLTNLSFGLNGNVNALAFFKGDLIAGGSFTAAGTNDTVRYIARLAGTNWVPLGNLLDESLTSRGVETIASIGDDLYIGGEFSNSQVAWVAKLVGTNWVALGSGVNDTVHALAVWNGQLLAGGKFTTAGGDTNAAYLAKWDGSSWSPLGQGSGIRMPAPPEPWTPTPVIKAVAVQGNDVFVGGQFDEFIGSGGELVQAGNIAHVQWDKGSQSWNWQALDQGVTNSFDYNHESYVSSIVLRQSLVTNSLDVIAGGRFTHAGLVRSGSAARWIFGDTDCTNALPSVKFNSPVSGERLSPEGHGLEVQAAGALGADIASVEFYLDGTDIGAGMQYQADLLIWDSLWSWDSTLAFGAHRFDAVATDINGLVNKATVFVVVAPNNAPVLGSDEFTVFGGGSPTVLDVLANDTDAVGIRAVNAYTWPGFPPRAGTVTIGYGGRNLVFQAPPNSFGTNFFWYSATNLDGVGGTAFVTVRVCARPVVQITSPADGAITNVPVTLPISVASFDYDGFVTNVDLYVNGNCVARAAQPGLTFSWTTNAPDFYTFTALATDNDGFTNWSAPVTIALTNATTSGSGHLPVAAITSPGPSRTSLGSVQLANALLVREGFLALTGSAYDPDGGAVSYQILLLDPRHPDAVPLYNVTPGPLNSRRFHDGAVIDASLGTVDLSLVDNGTYLLTLLVRGGGAEATASLLIGIESNLKIGQFSFSEQDLVIPVNGIPLTVTRTYNSLNPRSADFGYSWTYSLVGMDVQLDEQRQDVTIGSDQAPIADDAEDGDVINMRTGGGRDVTLTLPDGRRATFQFGFGSRCPCSGGDDSKSCYKPLWQAPPGVNYTLTAVGNPLYNGISRTWNNVDNTGFETFDFTGFTLLGPDGTRYDISRGAPQNLFYQDSVGHYIYVQAYGTPTLGSIVQRSGDRITIDPSGIKHYAAGTGNLTRSVLFDRDAQGRITAIYDPNAGSGGLPAVKYVYHAQTGNLLQVLKLTDRTAGTFLTTKYRYDNPGFPHYLTSIEDPRGIPVARNEYDDSGRLTAVVDADGKRTEFHHSTTNKTEVIIDRLGHTNTYVYDLRGNVTWVTNALNQVTRMAYDDNSNKIAETNAFGTSSATWTSYAYDDQGNQTSVVDSLNYTNSFAYDNYGNLLTAVDPLGNTTANSYDSAGNLTNTMVRDAQGNTVQQSFSHYNNGHLSETRDGNNNLTGTFYYDAAGSLTNVIDANGVSRKFAYDANGNQVQSTYTWTPPGGGGSVTVTNSTEYDAAGRVTLSVDALGNANRTFYTPLGKVDYTIDKFGNTNSFFYDARGNLVQTTYPDGLYTRTVYNADGKPYLTSDRNGITGTRMDYDALGRATNTVRLTNVVINIDPVGGGAWVTSISSAGTAISANATEYYANGLVKSRTGTDGQKTSYGYWPNGQLKTMTDPLTNVTFYAYDAAGRQQYVADPLNHTNRFDYDAVGRLIKTIYANNTYTTNIFNRLGQKTGVKDQAEVLTQFAYDVSGQLTNVTKAAVPDPQHPDQMTSPVWSYGYDLYGRLCVVTDPNGHATTNTYDALGREVGRSLALNRNETNVYNALGQLWKRVDFKGQVTEFKYDRYGRARAKYYFGSPTDTNPAEGVAYHYNALGQLQQIVELRGQAVLTNTTDGYPYLVALGMGRGLPTGLAQRVLASLSRVPTDLAGGLTALALAALAVVSLPRQMRRQLLMAMREACSLAPLEGLGTRATRRLRLPSLAWRAVSVGAVLLLVANDPALDRLWTANAVCSIPSNPSTANERVTNFAYDLEGRLAQVNSPEGVINYGYDLATGRHTSTCSANSEVAYGYDELGRLKTVTVLRRNAGDLATPEVTTYGYDAVGNRASVTLPNGTVTRCVYDALNRLTNLTHTASSGALLASYSYRLHPTGRRTNAVEVLLNTDESTYVTNTLSWQYDAMYRLTNEVSVSSLSANQYSTEYQYDQAGNRLAKLRHVGSQTETTRFFYDANDQLLREETSALSGALSTNWYAYDANGSLTGKTNADGVVLYSYNLANKLSSVTANSQTASYLYNDQGIRVQSSSGAGTTLYLLDANNPTGYAQVLEELAARGATPTMSYVLGDDVLGQCGSSSNDPRWLLYDGHGSTRQLLRGTAEVKQQYDYDAYGQTLGQEFTSQNPTDTSHLYCGEQYDTTLQMYNLRARYYSPEIGRFCTRDTCEGNTEAPLSLHKYLYCHDDPMTQTDPSGHWTTGELLLTGTIGATIGALSAGAVAEAQGRVVTVREVVFGAATGALLGLAAMIYAPAAVGLGLGGFAYSGISFGPIIFDPNATPEQRKASAVLIASSIYGAYAGIKMAGASRNTFVSAPTRPPSGDYVTIYHGTTLTRAISLCIRPPRIIPQDPSPEGLGFSGVEEGKQLPGYPTPKDYAATKASIRRYADEGGLAVLELRVPRWIYLKAQRVNGEVRFQEGQGIEELVQNWDKVIKVAPNAKE